MRYIPHTTEDIKEMLSASGTSSIEELFKGIPKEVRLGKSLDLPAPLSEPELLKHIEELGSKNSPVGENLSFLGAGAYQHFTPAAVGAVTSRSEWVTPYTPYQPEISQGTLQAIFEYQTMICNLTGMEVANASHYDGATATTEAALMALAKTRRKKIVVPSTLHPEYRDTIKTFLEPQKKEIVEIPFGENGQINTSALKEVVNSDTAGVIIQSPNFFGIIEELDDISEIVHDAGAMFIVAITEPVSLGILEGPGAFGADIVTAEGQSFGGGLNYGGPCLGIFATREKLVRSMPGRVVGQTKDTDGKRGFVLTMSTREQHIRRGKASSNICSNEALMVTTAAVHLALLGKEGLKKLAEINLSNAEYLKYEIAKINGIKIAFDGPTFNEFVIDVGRDTNKFCEEMAKKNIFAGAPLECWYPELKNCLLVTTTECHTRADLDRFLEALR